MTDFRVYVTRHSMIYNFALSRFTLRCWIFYLISILNRNRFWESGLSKNHFHMYSGFVHSRIEFAQVRESHPRLYQPSNPYLFVPERAIVDMPRCERCDERLLHPHYFFIAISLLPISKLQSTWVTSLLIRTIQNLSKETVFWVSNVFWWLLSIYSSNVLMSYLRTSHFNSKFWVEIYRAG